MRISLIVEDVNTELTDDEGRMIIMASDTFKVTEGLPYDESHKKAAEACGISEQRLTHILIKNDHLQAVKLEKS